MPIHGWSMKSIFKLILRLRPSSRRTADRWNRSFFRGKNLFLVLIIVLYMFPQLPLVDVLVDRVCALVESALEEKGAHCDG